MFLKKFAPPRRAVLEASVGLGLLLAVLLTCRFSSYAALEWWERVSGQAD